MGLFSKRVVQVAEERADLIVPTVDGVLLSAFLDNTFITKEQAMNIPSVQSCIKFACDTVSLLPIKLYKEEDGKVTEAKDDIRVKLLNDETGDTLDSVQFWKALIVDYYLGKGGYAYINKFGNGFKSLHYVDETQVSTIKNQDPIFKDYSLTVNAKQYKPYDFIKLLRNTKDGAKGTSLIEESGLILSLAYQSLVFEENLVKKGGNKKGFLKAAKSLTQDVIDKLRDAFKNLYSNNTESVVVLNSGLEFQESSNTSVEMQLNENKESNSKEICKLFNFPVNVINGNATEKEYANAFKLGILPLLKTIICALNKDLLLEREKKSYFYEFDTKEMLKGDMKARFEAYGVGIDKGFINIDEVRYMENWEPFGIDWINLGLNSVLYDPKTKTIYTPNTNKTNDITGNEPPEQTMKGSEELEVRS